MPLLASYLALKSGRSFKKAGKSTSFIRLFRICSMEGDKNAKTLQKGKIYKIFLHPLCKILKTVVQGSF
jgi:hypothetical protein